MFSLLNLFFKAQSLILLDSLHSFPKRINPFYSETFIWLTHLNLAPKLQSCIFTWFLGCYTLKLERNIIKNNVTIWPPSLVMTLPIFPVVYAENPEIIYSASLLPSYIRLVSTVNPFFEMRSSLSHAHITVAMAPQMLCGARPLHFSLPIIWTYSHRIHFPK